MKTISWDKNAYRLDGKPAFLVSGEFHYFRVPKEDWRKRLELFMEAGGNCVASYIPWILHEPEEGRILFGDKPERDLEGFLQLCGEMGIHVLCRPGPYQYSEMKYEGLPGWLCENYPEILARNIHGTAFRKASISYIHPLFLEKVKKWYDAVCPILSRYMSSKGGPVPFVQFDNELVGMHEWYSGWDYNPESMGFEKEEGRYPKFLETRYKNIAALNQAYDTRYDAFSEVRPVDGSSAKKPESLRCAKDYQDFYFSTIAEYAGILTGWMRELGIDCDFVHNSANPNMNSYFLETVKTLGERFLLGSDHYYNLDMDWEGNNPTPKYAVKVYYSNEMLRLMGFPSTVFEIPGGSCSEWPPITTEDLECCYLTNTALGMKGLNYYIFTGGPNPDHIGANGDSYDYGAPVGVDNSLRPHYHTQKSFGRFLKENAWLAEAEMAADFHIGLDWEHSRSRHYLEGQHFLEFSGSDAWTFVQKGLVITSLCASYTPAFVDLYKDSFTQETGKPLMIAASVSMAADIQRRLIRFVENGGQLLLSPVIPCLDESYQPCSLLKEFLEGASAERSFEASPRIHVGPVENVFMNEKLFVSSKVPKDAKVISVERNTGSAVGWKKTFPGGGSILWLGLCWKHSKIQHSAMVRYLLEELSCTAPLVQCNNPNVWAVARSSGQKTLVFAMNLFSAPMTAAIRLSSGMDLGCHLLKPMEVKILDV